RPRAAPNCFHQRRHRRRVAQARAVTDVVGAEAGAHQLLEQKSLLVRTFRRTEAGERPRAVAISNGLKAAGCTGERLLPTGGTEMRPGVGGIDGVVGVLGHAILAQERSREAGRMGHVVEAEAALDAEPILVCRSVAAADVEQLVILDVVGELAPDAAVGAYAVDLAIRELRAHVRRVDQGRRHQRAGRAGLHALTADDAGGGAHRIVKVEHDLLGVPAASHADDVVDLHLAAGAHTEIAMDAGIEIDRHCWMAAVGCGWPDRQLAHTQAGSVSIHASQAALPPPLPLALGLFEAPLARRLSGRVRNGTLARPLLPRMLLGALWCDACCCRDD